MTQSEAEFECPICLSVLILPITLPCGHTYCEPCIKHTHFRYLKNRCPVCRKKILLSINFFCVNLILEKMVDSKYGKDKMYRERRSAVYKQKFPSKQAEIWERVKEWARKSYPWLIIVLLTYHLVRVKINVFQLVMEKYKGKALEIAETIKRENSLDFKFLLFSQFMRILFSNIAIH